MEDSENERQPLIGLSQAYVVEDNSPEHEQRGIESYMAIEVPDEKITHIEKISSTTVAGKRYDVWDVHTDKQRWWAITNLTNVYEQSLFPSMDICLTFHIGYIARMNDTDSEPDEAGATLLRVSRQLDAANESLPNATGTEDFQAIGMKLRESLLSYVRELAPQSSTEAETPKVGDFIHWSEVIIERLTPKRVRLVRPLLKAEARELWQFVNALTHARSADRTVAKLAIDYAYRFYTTTIDLLRDLENEPEQTCPKCESRRLAGDPVKTGDSWNYVLFCTACGWRQTEAD